MRVLVVGAGRRVLEDVLPVFESDPDRYDVCAILASRARTLRFGARSYEVQQLSLTKLEDLYDLIYVAIPVKFLGPVMRRLSGVKPEVGVIIDTPADFGLRSSSILRKFNRVCIAEDGVRLPWLWTLNSFWTRHRVTGPISVDLDKSSYEYHGVALARAICATNGVVPAVDSRFIDGYNLRILLGEHSATITRPRDYTRGRIAIHRGPLQVSSHSEDSAQTLELIVDDSRCIGFRLGEITTELSKPESDLVGPVASGDNIVLRMLELKRVGLRRMLEEFCDGDLPWSVDNGAEDFRVATGTPGRFGKLSWWAHSYRNRW